MKIGLFQGTFDPITKGHIDIIKRASKLFDKLYVLIANNSNKKTFFTKDERVELVKECVQDISNVEVDSWDGLTVEYAKSKNVNVMVRGIRDSKDLEYEKIEEEYNKDLDSDIETIYLTNDRELMHVSSSGVRELLMYDKDVSKYVEKPVLEMIKMKKEGNYGHK